MKPMLSVFPLALLLSACGGSGSDSEPVPPTLTSTSTFFSLAVSDAPVDEAQAVVVYFDEVELISSEGNQRFSVTDESGNPRKVDLLSVQGSAFESIVSATEIPLGTYSQLRVSVTDASYIEMNEGTFPLKVPSGELKLDGFTALPNVQAAYTLEFDLRKSLVDPVGQQVIFLKPRGVRLVANSEVGVLEGTVASSLIEDASCADKVDPLVGNAVYLYAGKDIAFDNLGDDADSPTDTNEVSPYSMAAVNFDEATSTYRYQVGYVAAGDYTLAFTCRADLDMPETDEGLDDGFVLMQAKEAAVSAGQTTVLDFP
ncbi:DUF4382 domain-containing protein [Bowmanella yangjiangensis]|uniref:DUF4382 domain-containing protein n=1 Tax=Bowmanella yangjiangensis TaxID=2811230 RepID=A0ABS3CQT1_9ALTE|nr:DUF4382 domain-containing protein [Bowmanella yangjiangensis]MBN7819441.1 DUF4382 domain-containing protein [Bowmanella yangjiangensis]